MTEEMKKMLNNVFDLAIDECPTEDIKKINELQDYITNLQKENKDLKESNHSWQRKLSDYKQRNEKAIEYIKENTDKLKTTRIPKIDFNYNKLLNILQGGDE